MNNFSINGNLVDIEKQTITPVEIVVSNGTIISIRKISDSPKESLRAQLTPDSYRDHDFILPGFIDSHVHIESSMLIPSEFARLAVVHGTVATVSDPHEIANVCGMEGVEFMIENGKTVPFKFNFGAPSCVPATIFETAGASLDAKDVEDLLKRDEIKYLSEMMNFPGVLNEDEEVMKKIAAAHRLLKPVDGHAPGLRGEQLKKYIAAPLNLPEGETFANTQSQLFENQKNIQTSGSVNSQIPPSGGGGAVISTDHECFTYEEALEKLQYGMKIIIREGSAAKNFEALIDLLNDYPNQMMFCSDDKHPDSLVEGHINQLCARAIAKGIDLFKVLKAACINPIKHYKLDVGLLKEGDPADFIVVKDLKKFEVLKTFINGELVAEEGKSLIVSQEPALPAGRSGVINNFSCSKKNVEDFEYRIRTHDSPKESLRTRITVPVIEALDGQLITNNISAELLQRSPFGQTTNHQLQTDLENDILKIVVVNRYKDSPVAKAFIKNFGLKKGAIASSVAHDSHNIVAVGVDDESICDAVNLVIEKEGGVSATDKENKMILALPVAGLMSNEDGYKIAAAYTQIDKMAKEELGSTLNSPFMTLSFMALLVIPHLKLSDKGLFDGDKFEFIN